MAFTLGFLLASLYLANCVWAQNASDFDWTSIQPSDTLNWTSCYSSFQCARLSVPIDYSAPQGSKAAIAIIRLPATVSSTDPTYAGPIFFNPGGPGGSGVTFLLTDTATILGTAGGKYDLVSFDPRGVSFSTPTVSFFNSDADRSVWDFSASGLDVNSSSPSLQIPRLWARSQALGYLAEARDNGIFAHVTTDNVARDMWSMVQAYNQTKLQYYGLSYGTIIGATFATLFPDKVGRMVLDGVVNPQAYFSADWAKELLTTDKGLDDFFDSCHAAGPNGCAFYESTTSQIEQRYNNLFTSLRNQPVVIHSNSTFGIVDEATLRATVFQVLYTPYPGFSLLAPALAALERGDGSQIFQLFGGPTLDQCSADSTLADNTIEASAAIACGDAIVEGTSAADLIQYYQHNIGISSFLDNWLEIRAVCTGWRSNRNDTFHGPVGGNTSFPILLIGNTADPVTPLVDAVTVSGAFPGSAVLTRDSPGHTSFGSPSSCTIGHIIQYFTNGTLPSKGTVCPVDSPPFNSTSSVTTKPPSAGGNSLVGRFRRRQLAF